jgi:hypothetical protein
MRVTRKRLGRVGGESRAESRLNAGKRQADDKKRQAAEAEEQLRQAAEAEEQQKRAAEAAERWRRAAKADEQRRRAADDAKRKKADEAERKKKRADAFTAKRQTDAPPAQPTRRYGTTAGHVSARKDVPNEKPWYRGRAFELGLALVTLVIGSVVVPLVLLSSTEKQIPPPVSERIPGDAVQEIAFRPFWSSPPAMLRQADRALGAGLSPDVLPASEITPLKNGPKVVTPAVLAEHSAEYEEGQIVLVGKVGREQTVTSRFVGDRPNGRPGPQKPAIQLELVGNHRANTYVEVLNDVLGTPVAPGQIVVMVGRLSNIGETDHEHVKTAAVLAEQVEVVKRPSELDSVHMRQLWKEAAEAPNELKP